MKTFKKTFKFICEECGEFSHTEHEYCEKCGAKALRKAIKDDYVKYETKKKADSVIHEEKRKTDDARRITEKAKINAVKGANEDRKISYDKYQEKKRLIQKETRMENIEENLEQYKKYQQALKSDLARLSIILKRNTIKDNQKEKLNTCINLLKEEIEMVRLMIDTYEIRAKVKKLNKEHKELVSRNLEGEFVEDLMKSNRFEVELLNRKDKENSDIIKELIRELNEKKRKYRDDYEMSDIEQKIELMKKRESEIPNGPQKDKLIEMKQKIEINTKVMEMFKRNENTLLEIVKNDEEYKILMEGKNAGESVENLIKENRSYAETLAKKDKKYSEEAKKWSKSEEGRIWFKEAEEMRRMNPVLARDSDNRYRRGLKLINEIKMNEEEYKRLLERKNKGEYVDDLIKQNRYTAKVLTEQNKNVWNEPRSQGLTMKKEVKSSELQREKEKDKILV